MYMNVSWDCKETVYLKQEGVVKISKVHYNPVSSCLLMENSDAYEIGGIRQIELR